MRKLLALLLALSLSPIPAFATAFGAATAWDVETTGSDTNGGAFDSGVGSPGTNESTGSGTAITITLASSTTGTGSPAFTSTTHGPGNFVHIASGSGCTVGWYEVLSQSAGTATFNVAMGSTSNVCVGTIGGPLTTTTLNTITNTLAVTLNTVWIKSGTYTLTSTVNINGANYGNLSLTGYGSTHGDNGTAPLITTATNSIDLFTFTGGGTASGSTVFQDISFSNTAGTRATALTANGGSGFNFPIVLINDTFDGFSNAIYGGGTFGFYSIQAYNSVFKNTTARAIDNNTGATLPVLVENCTFLTIGSDAIRVHGGQQFIRDSSFSGITGIGYYVSSSTASITDFEGNSLQTVTGNGFQLDALTAGTQLIFKNNIIYAAAKAVVITTLAAGSTIAVNRNNAYGGNGSGNTNFAAGAGDVSLSNNPFTSSTNFALNSNATGGALAKAAGFPGTSLQGTVGFLDIGAFQSQASGGGSVAGNYGTSN